jgi:hydrogenase maturation protease
MSTHNLKNVILGIGNYALSDNAAGLKTTRFIQKIHPNLTMLEVVDGTNLSYELTAVVEQAQNLIVINAAKLDHSPGTITILQGNEMDLTLRRLQRTADETALADILEIARLAKQLAPNRAFICIEPKKTSWGTRISSCVNKAVPLAADEALALMSQWTGLVFRNPPPPADTTQNTNP